MRASSASCAPRSPNASRRPNNRSRRWSACSATRYLAGRARTRWCRHRRAAQGRASLFNPNSGPHTSAIAGVSDTAGHAATESGRCHERGPSEARQLVPRRRDVLRSRWTGQTGHQLRIAEGRDVGSTATTSEQARRVIRQVEEHHAVGRRIGGYRSQPGGKLPGGQRGRRPRESRAARHQRDGRRATPCCFR